MSETDLVTVGRALPKLCSVEPAGGRYGVRIVWADGPRVGQADTVDLAPIILTFKVFKPLRDDLHCSLPCASANGARPSSGTATRISTSERTASNS